MVVAVAVLAVRLQAAPPQTAEQVYKISDNVDLVLLDVSVQDPRGGYVTGLTRDDFAVIEDGQTRQITHFASVDTPVTVGLIVDNSGSMRFKRPEVVMAGLAFAKESNSKDEFFVVNFNNSIVRGLPARTLFTDNLQKLRAALYYGEPMGQTALYDAIAYSLKHLELSTQDKRTLIVVSDGGDNVSKTSLPELMSLIAASRATIYTVGLLDPEDRDLNPGPLRRIARISGGEFFEPPTLNDVVPVFHKISKDIRNRYTIGYVPDETHDKRIVRSVKVAAQRNGRKLIVRTRTTYTNTPFSQLLTQQSWKDTGGKEQQR
ncbi:MAG: VWA domain-containing protein [Bryobacteraceae bacterium]